MHDACASVRTTRVAYTGSCTNNRIDPSTQSRTRQSASASPLRPRRRQQPPSTRSAVATSTLPSTTRRPVACLQKRTRQQDEGNMATRVERRNDVKRTLPIAATSHTLRHPPDSKYALMALICSGTWTNITTMSSATTVRPSGVTGYRSPYPTCSVGAQPTHRQSTDHLTSRLHAPAGTQGAHGDATQY